MKKTVITLYAASSTLNPVQPPLDSDIPPTAVLKGPRPVDRILRRQQTKVIAR